MSASEDEVTGARSALTGRTRHGGARHAGGMGITRLLELADVPRLAELAEQNRTFLAPWEPIRDDRYVSVAGQKELVESLLSMHAHRAAVPHVILDAERQVCGRITLAAIERGPFQSGRLGYWVAADHIGRGLATAAVAAMKRLAFDQLGLHRIEAGTLPHNAASQRVLERNGFVRFGLAPAYLNIAGVWQDHVMYQVLSPDPLS